MSSENFSNNRISRDETIKYLKSIKNELNEKFEKTKKAKSYLTGKYLMYSLSFWGWL